MDFCFSSGSQFFYCNYDFQKEGQPIASSTASTTRAVLEEHIPSCERNLAQNNGKFHYKIPQ